LYEIPKLREKLMSYNIVLYKFEKMFTADIITLSVGYPQEWMAKSEMEAHPNNYPGGFVKQYESGTWEWYIVREKDDWDYIND
jgi:hypothetical protein